MAPRFVQNWRDTLRKKQSKKICDRNMTRHADERVIRNQDTPSKIWQPDSEVQPPVKESSSRRQRYKLRNAKDDR